MKRLTILVVVDNPGIRNRGHDGTAGTPQSCGIYRGNEWGPGEVLPDLKTMAP
jgi:hypothetical protein